MTLYDKALSGAAIGIQHRQRALTRCAAAYASGNAAIGERLFADAHAEILPLVRRVVLRATDASVTAREDMEQDATLKIWQVLRRGIEPDVKRVTYHAVVDAYRTRTGTGDARSMTPRERAMASRMLTMVEDYQGDDDDSVNHMIDKDSGAEYDAVIDRLAVESLTTLLAAHDDAWGVIAQHLADGCSQNETARLMGVSRWVVNGHVVAMGEWIRGVE